MTTFNNPTDIILDQDTIDKLTIFENSVFNGLFYHATKASFNEFDDSKRGINTEASNTLHGFFFTEKLEHANQLIAAQPGDFGNNIIKVKIDVKKPIYITIPELFIREEQASTIWKILTGETKQNAKALQLLNKNIGLGEIAEVYSELNSENCQAILKAQGYDCIVSNLGNDIPEYIVFNSYQIQILTPEAIALSCSKKNNPILLRSLLAHNKLVINKEKILKTVIPPSQKNIKRSYKLKI